MTSIRNLAGIAPYVQPKNYIINGAMMVSQENGSTAANTAAYYPVDQFFATRSNDGNISVGQVASTTSAGSPNRIRVTVTSNDSSIASGQYQLLWTKLEGYRVADLMFGSSSAKTITLKFGVKAPAGTYCVAFANSAQNRTYVAEYTVSSGEANIDVYKTVTVPGDITGTWLTTTGIGLNIIWTLATGSTYQTAAGSWAGGTYHASSNQFNFIGTNSNVFELFDVGLYMGAKAPDFVVTDYAQELRFCQRYYFKDAGAYYTYAEGTSTGVGASACAANVKWHVSMRIAPTVTIPTYTTIGVGTPSTSGITTEGMRITAISTGASGTRMVFDISSGSLIANARM